VEKDRSKILPQARGQMFVVSNEVSIMILLTAAAQAGTKATVRLSLVTAQHYGFGLYGLQIYCGKQDGFTRKRLEYRWRENG
jgi:hypothetical protein